MDNSPQQNATFSRLFLAACVLLCGVFISHAALAEKPTRCLLAQAHASATIAEPYYSAQQETQGNPPLTKDQILVNEPVLAPDVACRSVVFSLPQKHKTSSDERHVSSKALQRTPKFPRVLAAPVEVCFLWRNQEDNPPPSSGMRDLVRFTLPPPLPA